MILHRLRLMNGDQRGFTLIELAVVVVLTSIIMAALTTSALQMINGTALSNNRMTVVNNVLSAGEWISQDTRIAKNATTPASDAPFLILTLEDFDGVTTTTHQVKYSYCTPPLAGPCANTPDKTIVREFDTDPAVTIAQSIPNRPTASESNRILTVTVTATAGSGTQQATENRTYEIRLRNDS